MSQRRNLNVFDVLGLIDDGNDSDVGDLLSEDDSDSDDDYTPNDETDNDDESEWDDNDDIPLQQLQAAAADSQPPKRRRGDTNNYTWRKTTYEPPDTAFKGDPFDNPKEISMPYQYFQQFIDSEMIEQLTEQTNIYAFQQTGKLLAVTQKELEQVIGMYFGMGLVRMPNSRMYWENDTRYAPVADIMSRS